MHLLAADYQDIGPFEGHRTVVFQEHATLIQAPVGSGKSFLFFDGIVFGLYKYSQRPLLRRHAEKGSIIVLRQQRDGVYLVHRALTRGKTKDRTQSTLYRVDDTVHGRLTQHYGDTVLHQDKPLRDALRQSSVELTEIPTKTDSELQKLLDELLPPRTVLTNTQLLLQDSDNLFTMSPADRITVFQHLFNLLDIDAAKDIISDTKRDTQTRIRVLSDTTRLETKYRELIRQIQQQSSTETGFGRLFTDWLLPVESLEDLAIEETTLPQGRAASLTSDIASATTQLETLQSQHSQYDQQAQVLQTSRTQKDRIQSQSTQLDRQIQTLEQSMQGSDTSALEQALSTKNLATQNLQQAIQDISRSSLTPHIEPRVGTIEGFASTAIAQQDHRGLQTIITQLIAYGRELRTAQEHAKQLAQRETDQRTKDISTTTKNIQTATTSLESRQRQFTDIISQYDKIQKESEVASQVSCPHCQGDITSLCTSTDQANTILETLTKQKASLEREITTLQKTLTNEAQKLTELEKPTEAKEDTITPAITQLGQTMKAIQRQSLQSQIETISEMEKTLSQSTQTYDRLRQQADRLQSQQIELTKFQTQKTSLTTQIADLEKTIQEQITKLGERPDAVLLQQTKTQLITLQQIQTMMDRLTELHSDLHQQILQRKDLEIRAERLKNLHQILSKELMYMVLETALPSLFSIINALLSQVVDYQLHFALVKSGSDRLELEIEVEDAKGRRSISSLSGGQKVILKMARILAVASYLRLPLLLLDETINNLDAELISRVAELIDDVIRKQDMTLYVVTHSPHIQQMNVWEEIVEVK